MGKYARAGDPSVALERARVIAAITRFLEGICAPAAIEIPAGAQ